MPFKNASYIFSYSSSEDVNSGYSGNGFPICAYSWYISEASSEDVIVSANSCFEPFFDFFLFSDSLRSFVLLFLDLDLVFVLVLDPDVELAAELDSVTTVDDLADDSEVASDPSSAAASSVASDVAAVSDVASVVGFSVALVVGSEVLSDVAVAAVSTADSDAAAAAAATSDADSDFFVDVDSEADSDVFTDDFSDFADDLDEDFSDFEPAADVDDSVSEFDCTDRSIPPGNCNPGGISTPGGSSIPGVNIIPPDEPKPAEMATTADDTGNKAFLDNPNAVLNFCERRGRSVFPAVTFVVLAAALGGGCHTNDVGGFCQLGIGVPVGGTGAGFFGK